MTGEAFTRRIKRYWAEAVSIPNTPIEGSAMRGCHRAQNNASPQFPISEYQAMGKLSQHLSRITTTYVYFTELSHKFLMVSSSSPAVQKRLTAAEGQRDPTILVQCNCYTVPYHLTTPFYLIQNILIMTFSWHYLNTFIESQFLVTHFSVVLFFFDRDARRAI